MTVEIENQTPSPTPEQNSIDSNNSSVEEKKPLKIKPAEPITIVTEVNTEEVKSAISEASKLPQTPITPLTPKPESTSTETTRKFKKSSKRRNNDVKHVSRKLIMAWKLASEHQGTITWKEIAPVIDSVEYISSHWKNDERLKDIEPVAVDIVSQVNKIHLELNLRVFGMNRLRIITEEFLNLLKRDRDSFIQDTKEKEEKAESESTVPTTSTESTSKTDTLNNEIEKIEKNRKVESKLPRSKEDLLDRLINSLTQLYNLLNEPAETKPAENNSVSSAPNSPKPSQTLLSAPTTTQQKHKSKKRNIFSGFFSSSDKKQNSSSSGSNSGVNSPELSASSFPSGLEVYKNNIVSEWQEYTRKFVEPNYLFKVCKCYLAANPQAIPPKASLIGQNWICVANEISMSLWNILKKREDDLASSLIFLTLYKHGSPEIIERAINTIGSQLPHHFFVRLEYALNLKEYDQFTKEEKLMLDGNYKLPEPQPPQPPVVASPSLTAYHKKSNSDYGTKRTGSTHKKDKKKHSSLSTKSDGEGDDDEPISFADMLAMKM